jgi:hypothetical protein
MPSTPTYAFPYPAPSEPADVPTDMGELATRMETVLAGFLTAGIVDAKGDLLVGSAADTLIRLAAGTNGQVLTADSAVTGGLKWAAAGGGGGSPTLVTALPGSPTDGQQVVLVDSLTAPTYWWTFRYIAAKATNKWVFVGGTPATVKVAAAETATSTTYVALTTPGPSFTVPVAGAYTIRQSARVVVASAVNAWAMSYDIGATGAVDGDALQGFLTTANQVLAATRESFQPALAAGTALVSKYKSTAGTPTWSERLLTVTPAAVS